MSIYTQTETLSPLSYHYVNNDIDSKQKQLARDRMADNHHGIKPYWVVGPLYLFNGKNWSINK